MIPLFRPFLPVFLCFLAFAANAQKVEAGRQHYARTFRFETANWKLDAKTQKALSAFTDSITKIHGAEKFNVQITGYTDSVGSVPYNIDLSEKRAQFIQDHLVNSRMGIAQLNTGHKGEAHPRSPNDLSRNRRVEVILDRVTEPVADNTADQEYIRDLYKQTAMPLQRFMINTQRDTLLVGKQNTWIYIRANTFSNCGGKDSVEFRLKEVYKESDMVLENLSTTASGQMLETGGMLYAEAVCPLSNEQLKPQKELLFMIPTDTLRADMRLFNGTHGADDIIDWARANNPLMKDIIGWTPDLCGGLDEKSICARCKFNCRIKRFGKPFQGIFNADVRAENWALRQCQKNYRIQERRLKKGNVAPQTVQRRTDLPDGCAILKQLMEKYDAKTYQEMVTKMNQHLLDSFKVKNMGELQDTLRKISMAKAREEQRKFMERMEKGEVENVYDLERYTFNTRTLGWINCDAFSALAEAKKIDMKVNTKMSPDTDCKLVFRNRRAIMPAYPEGDHYVFRNIPRNEPAILVVLKIAEGKPQLYLRELKTQQEVEGAVPVTVSMPELKKQLAVLDF